MYPVALRYNGSGRAAATVAFFVLSASTALPVFAIANPPQEIVIPSGRVIVSETYLARVEKVIDGDTLLIQSDNRRETKRIVHLFGISAPRGSEAQAKEAKDFLKNSAQGKRVRVETRRRNRDGTIEASVTLLPPPPPRAPLHMEPTGIRSDMPRGTEGAATGTASSGLLLSPETDRNLNYGMLRAGLARRSNAAAPAQNGLASGADDYLARAEDAARQDKIGIWSVPPVPPTPPIAAKRQP